MACCISPSFYWRLGAFTGVSGRLLAGGFAPRLRASSHDGARRALSGVAGAAKRSHYRPMSLAPFSSAPRASKEPPTFREARDLLLELGTTITARGPRSSGRGPSGSTGRSNGSTPSSRPESMGARPRSRSSAIASRRGPSRTLRMSRRGSPTACARSAPSAAIGS